MANTQDAEVARLLAENRLRLLHYVLTLLPNIQDAEDVVQETSIVVIQRSSEYRVGSNFLAWAAQIAFNKVRNLRRSPLKPAVILDDKVLDALGTQESPMANFDAHIEALRGCLEKLSVSDRSLFSRRYADGVASRRLADELQRDESSISQSLRRIRVTLANCVQRKLSQVDGGA